MSIVKQTIINLPVLVLRTTNASICLQMCLNIAQLVIIYAKYHDIACLLLLTIIASNKNYTISTKISIWPIPTLMAFTLLYNMFSCKAFVELLHIAYRHDLTPIAKSAQINFWHMETYLCNHFLSVLSP